MVRQQKKKAIILAVDDAPANLGLLFEFLDDAEFEVLVSQNGQSAIKRVHNTPPPDLILLDVIMPGMDGFETCRRLKADQNTKDIPVIFMTALGDTVDKVKGFSLGAVDYITKPIEAEEVLGRIKTHLTLKYLQDELKTKNVMLANREIHLMHLVEEKTQTIENITLALVNALEHANALNDLDTGKHLKRVGEYAALLADLYGCKQDFVKRIHLYAPLHDVGKVGLSDALLKKSGKYTAEERTQMQQHVVFGASVLGREGIDAMSRNIALYHHERWDGTGYVNRLAGETIPLEARIVALVDVYDALLSKRVYKQAFSEEKAKQLIREERGKHFEPGLVDIFFQHLPAIQKITQTFV